MLVETLNALSAQNRPNASKSIAKRDQKTYLAIKCNKHTVEHFKTDQICREKNGGNRRNNVKNAVYDETLRKAFANLRVEQLFDE